MSSTVSVPASSGCSAATYAGGSVAENLTPVGRAYYVLSTVLCVPHAISEGAADALGNGRRGKGALMARRPGGCQDQASRSR